MMSLRKLIRIHPSVTDTISFMPTRLPTSKFCPRLLEFSKISCVANRSLSCCTLNPHYNRQMVKGLPPDMSFRSFHSSALASQAGAEDPRGKLIYTGGNSTPVKVVKVFSLTTSIIGIALQPWLFMEMEASNIAFKVAVICTTSFFVFGTPLILHFLCKRYVLRLYFNEQTKVFTAIRVNLFAREKSFTFTPDEVEMNTPSPFSNFKAGQHSFLLDSDQLRETHPEVYIAFMNYDKPIDISEFLDPKYTKPVDYDQKLKQDIQSGTGNENNK